MNQEQPIGSDQQGLVSARRRSAARWELKSRVALTGPSALHPQNKISHGELLSHMGCRLLRRRPGLQEVLEELCVRNMVFFELFLCCFSRFLCYFTLSTFFSLSFTPQEKTIRMLLIPRRSRAQRTTTTDDLFQELSRRPSLRVVLQVHLPLVVPRDLPQQGVSLFTR